MSDKVDKKEAADQAKDVKKAHAATGKPLSPAEDPTDHSTSAAAIAPKSDKNAEANAKSLDAVNEKAEEKEKAELAEEDKTIVGKIRRSNLFFVRDHSVGLDYVGISPQNDPKASDASKLRSTVTPLDVTPPRAGMTIKPTEGESFQLGSEFGLDTTPGDWAKVLTPKGDPLFA